MSGIEVFGTIASVFTVIEVSENVVNFLQNVKEADVVAGELRGKARQLKNCARTVQRTLLSRREQIRQGQIPDEEEIEAWKVIHSTLRECKRELKRLNIALTGLDQSNMRLDWLRKAILQRKIDKREPRIARLEKTINLHLTTMQIVLQIIFSYVLPWIFPEIRGIKIIGACY
jgi:hypothetical protein